MSARKPKNTDTRRNHSVAAKKKKKQFMKTKYIKLKPPPKERQKAPALQYEPPKDDSQFSANWSSFQEILAASREQEQKKKKQQQQQPPMKPKDQSATGPKQGVEASVSKNNTHHKHRDTWGKVKPKTLVPKESQVNPQGPGVSETKRSDAPKRKSNIEKSNGKPATKKQKPEERKPTEDDLWFDDVDPDDVEATVGAEAAEIMRKKQGVHKNKDSESALVKEKGFEGLTKAVAIDCEMVGVGPGGEDSILARVSLVNKFGKCIYDKFVKPTEKVTDYRTAVSGIRPADIKDGEDLRTVQREVAEILKGRIVVGHAIHNDLKILLLDHPKKKIRDTQKYKPFKKAVKSGRPSLKILCRDILHVAVQQGEHSSVQDAQATMRLYMMAKQQWEAEIKANQKNKEKERSARKPKTAQNKDSRVVR